METRNILRVAYFVLAIYAFGGSVVGGVMYYPSWKLVSAEDLPAVHKSVLSRVFIYVAFVFLAVLVNILLIWLHHPAMSTTLVIITAALHLFILVVSLTLFLRIHKQLDLDKAKSVELIERIVMYGRYLRAIPGYCLVWKYVVGILNEVLGIT